MSRTVKTATALLCLMALPAAADLPFGAQDIENATFSEKTTTTAPQPAPAENTGTAAATDIQSMALEALSDPQIGEPSQHQTKPTEQKTDTGLPDDRSALAAKVQILLDRAGISPGVIDGYSGGMSETALRAFEARAGLPQDGKLDREVWTALGGDVASGLTTVHTISEDDLAGLSAAPLPDDYADLAKLDQIGFTSVAEKLAERYHMDEEFLRALNPGIAWQIGETITVMNPQAPTPTGTVARIVVDKANSRLRALSADGAVITDYPVTVGSSDTPSPNGTVAINAVAIDPTYSYNPDVNFKQGDNTEPLTLPPGPNGPVGSVWIDLDKPTYGLHGTPYPDKLFTNQSHGCVRLTNWDVTELAEMVSATLSTDHAPVMVEFME